MKKKNIILISIAILVLIAGIVFGLWKKEKIQQEKIKKEQADVTEKQEDMENIGVEDWKTYINKEYGFEIKYPHYLKPKETWEGKYLSLKFYHNQGMLLLTVYVKTDNNVETLDEREKKNLKTDVENIKTERIKIDQESALKTNFSGNIQSPDVEEIYIFKNNKSYTLFLTLTGVSNLSDDKEDIISSFKFLENDDKLAWYEIPELGIKLKLLEEVSSQLTYSAKSYNKDGVIAYFSSKNLEKINSNCNSEFGPLGAISRIEGAPEGYDNYIDRERVKEFDNFFLYYSGPQAPCLSNSELWKNFKKENPELENWLLNVFNEVDIL